MKTIRKFLLLSSLASGLCFLFPSGGYAQYPGQSAPLQKTGLKITPRLYAFDLGDVRLPDSRFSQNMERDAKWLLAIDSKRLLHNWRVNAGIASTAKALGGWEGLDVELRGHTMGHVLSGLALMYASTGKNIYAAKAGTLVRGLAECQEALNQNGYLSAFPQEFINRVIAGKPVWAPWYTLHKVMAGLTDLYLYAGNRQALEIAEKMSGWAYEKLQKLSPAQLATMQSMEFGGMNEVAYNLYSVTGNERDKMLAGFFYQHSLMDTLARKEDRLAKKHANTQIPKVIGAARGYELTGDPKLKTISEFFWQTVVDHHTYATGGNSDAEIFFEPDKISKHLSSVTTETCNTYNMLKLTRHLFTWTGDVKYADYYERALYNHILASQDEQTGMVTYYTSTQPGLFKTYSTPDDSFWCCVGTGFENHAKYGESIYYHDDQGIYVNLFIPSVLNWKEKGLHLSQHTDFPEKDNISLIIDDTKAGSFPIHLRYPSWATAGATVKVNGKAVKVTNKPGSYIVLNRAWKKGYRIDISFPMSLRLVKANDNPKLAAVAYGPLVLAGDLGSAGMTPATPFENVQADPKKYNIPPGLPTALYLENGRVSDRIRPMEGKPLMFKANIRQADEVTLVPYYLVGRDRYTIYWNLK